MPQFSIVIPTRDRPKVLADCIKYCLSQTFKNFEVVIVDNGTDNLTKELFDSLDDTRLRYVRTGGLSMPDNWDRALSEAQGDYIYIIGDKVALHREALAILYDGIKEHKEDLLTFPRIPAFLPSTTGALSNSWKKVPSSIPLEALRAGRLGEFTKWFNSYTVIVSKRLAATLREKYSRVITPLSPDYTLAYICLLHKEYFLSGSTPLFSHHLISGNGYSFYCQGKLAKEFLTDCDSSLADAVAFSPIPVVSNPNALISDFFRVCDFIKMETDYSAVDLQHLWKSIYADMCFAEAMFHIDKSREFRALFQFAEDNSLFSSQDFLEFLGEQSLVTRQHIMGLERSVAALQATVAEIRNPLAWPGLLTSKLKRMLRLGK